MPRARPPQTPPTERVNGWLEDSLVASRRAELWIDLLHTFEALPKEERRSFVEQLPDSVKYYMARDATYMHIVRLGEALAETTMPKLRFLVHSRGLPESRNDVKNPIGLLTDLRNKFNHPEKSLMPEPDLLMVGQWIMEAKRDLGILYPEINFHTGTSSTPAPEQATEGKQQEQPRSPWDDDHAGQILWHPGMSVEHTGPFGDDPFGLEEHLPESRFATNLTSNLPKRHQMENLSQLTAKIRNFVPSDIGPENFASVIHQALHFRTMRLGSLVRAMEREKESDSTVLLPRDTVSRVTKYRSQIAHFYDTIRFTPDILKEEAARGKRFSTQVEDVIQRRGINVNEARFAEIPQDNAAFIAEILERVRTVHSTAPDTSGVQTDGAESQGKAAPEPPGPSRGKGGEEAS